MIDVQIMPALDEATERALTDSISDHGVIVPVVVDQNRRIIDGHNRDRIAKSLGMDYEVTEKWVRDEDHAREIARTLNEDRRQLMDIDTRRAVVRRLREQGHSTRAIAGALGVSNKTVHKDLHAAPVTPVTPAAEVAPSEPVRVTGKDGKSYPTRPAPTTLSPADLDELVARHRGGDSYKKLAAEVNMTPKGLSTTLRSHTGEIAPPPPPATTQYAFVTTIEVVHGAPTPAAADVWARKRRAMLEKAGGTITSCSTQPT